MLPFYSKSSQEPLLRENFLTFAQSDELEKIRNLRREICELERYSISSCTQGKEVGISFMTRAKQRRVSLLLTSFAFSRSFSYAKVTKSKLWYPLPKNWIPIVEKNGYSVNKLVSGCMYTLTCTYLFSRNMLNLIKSFISQEHLLYSEFFSNDQWLTDDRAVLIGINKLEVLRQDKGGSFKNFGNWLLANSKKLGIANTQSHLYLPEMHIPESVTKTGQFHKPMSRIKLIFALFRNLRQNSLKELVAILEFIDVSELLLYQRIQEGFGVHCNFESKLLIFNNSQKNYKPIWVDLMQDLGARVCLMFYSTETEPMYLSGRIPPIEFWGLAQWPEYWFVDEWQRSRFLSLELATIEKECIIGYPWWSDNEMEFVLTNSKIITLFSLEPHQSDYSLVPNYTYGFGDPNLSVSSLQNILEMCQEYGILLRHKVKRTLNSERFPIYSQSLQEFKNRFSDNYEIIDSTTSPSRLIESSDLVISNPYTTTGVEAYQKGKPSIFYINSTIFPDNPAGFDQVELLRNKFELRSWLEENL
jgi:polysaccharide biosynthesis PFTS motif protein